MKQVKSRIISQLINGISRVLQKLLKYFKGTTISTFFLLPSSGIFPVTLILDLNDSDSVILSFGASLYYCHILLPYALICIIAINLMFLNSYQCILLNYTLTSQYLFFLAWYIWVLSILLIHSVNGAKFLNVTFLFLSSASFFSIIISFSSNCYSSANKYVCITMIT